jgi:hypothetical protein
VLTTEYAWRVEQGEREQRSWPVTLDGDEYDITGWAVSAVIRASHRQGATVLYTWPAELIVITGDELRLEIPAATSLAWSFEMGWYRIKITAPDGVNTQRIASGVFVLDAD